jgi:Mg2+-importing ATPase
MKALSGFEGYWSQTVENLTASLGSDPQGLTSPEAERRLQAYGPNTLEARKKATVLGLFLNQFRSPLLLILLFATGVSAITKDWVDALIILAIVVGSGLLGFIQEYNASAAVEKLRAQVRITTSVLRDGKAVALPAEEIVPGDVVRLSAGSLIPADAILLEARDFYVNQAVLTGETFPVEKKPGSVALDASLAERTNCVFMGTNVRSGSARALIIQTGQATAFGQIAQRLTVRPPETEFEHGVRRFGYMLSQMMLILVVAVFAINVYFQKPILDALLFSIALAVGITPELLPAIISVNLSKGSQTMAAEGVIVRRLNSIENFGSMDMLCTDKTGTLTEGVVHLDGALDTQGQPSQEIFRYAYLNASLQTGLSNPLDEAILAQPKLDFGDVTKLDEIPYDFVRKRMSVVVRQNGQPLMIAKGALDNVIEVCTQVTVGSDIALEDARREEIRARFAEWSKQGFRVLGLAIRLLPEKEGYHRDDEREMTFVGFLLFLDPPKPGVQKTIEDLASMGISLKIITGDNRLVAMHTAESIGMSVTGVLTGAEINRMRDEALWQNVERVNLFVEVDPNQKERIILALRKMGHVVGYMGDGINDAPSLHAADVGISVDQAVDVAKEAADFVLLERDLDVLRRGVLMGRTTFANTLKYVHFTTSGNFGNMFSMAGASLFLPFLPLLPMQILLMNFLTDFPAITIASDLVDQEQLERPHRWNIRHIRDFMIVFGSVSSVFDYLTFGLLLLILHANVDQFRTGWFFESVMTELFIMLVIRTQRPFFKSKIAKPLLISTMIVALFTLVLPFSPLSKLLGFTPLSLPLLISLLAIAGLYILATEGTKRLFYRHSEGLKWTRKHRAFG